MSTMKEKMHTGELYLPGDEEIMKEQVVYQDLLCSIISRKRQNLRRGQGF